MRWEDFNKEILFGSFVVVVFFLGVIRRGCFFCGAPPCGNISCNVITKMYSEEEEEQHEPLQ